VSSLTQHAAAKSLLLLSVLLLGPVKRLPGGQSGLGPLPFGFAQVASNVTVTLSALFGGLPSGVVVEPVMGKSPGVDPPLMGNSKVLQ
jgi:hypothetical protein